MQPQNALAIVLIGPQLAQIQAAGREPHFRALSAKDILTNKQMRNLVAVEEVHMVGYPIGIWDSRNNLPVVRRGVTATPPYIDYEGQSRFMIDMACFPGSSGSPIFLMNSGMYTDKKGTVRMGEIRFGLLGILYAGPKMTQEGHIEIVEVPTAVVPITKTDLMLNLGYCIKAERILDFEPLLIRGGIEPPKGYISRQRPKG